MPVNRALPPGPRDYWNELAAEHQAAPEHQQWMYAADPFAALQEVKERQAKAAQKREATNNSSESRPGSAHGPYSDSPEVKMATSLREEVEEAIKEVILSVTNYKFPRNTDPVRGVCIVRK